MWPDLTGSDWLLIGLVSGAVAFVVAEILGYGLDWFFDIEGSL